MKASLYIFVFLYCSIISCSKKEFLDERPRSDLFVPNTLDDFQALLDNDVAINVTPVLGELSADNFYIIKSFWENLGTKEKNAYIWAPDIFKGEGKVSDWNAPYEQILYANVVIKGLEELPRTKDNGMKWDHIKGSAHFIRAYAFYNLAQVFALPYNTTIATKEDTGIPLKTSPNVDEPIRRSTLEQTYTQILNDLLEAKSHLADSVTSNRNRPNKPAAFAQLARVYLSMREYGKAGLYADSSLQIYRPLIDYSTRDTVIRVPWDRTNTETMYQSRFVETNVLKGVSGFGLVDSSLLKTYAQNDFRRNLFFWTNSGRTNFKGSYTGFIQAFTGLATDETYLIRAECRARSGDINGAMEDLNTLLLKRWRPGTFIPYTASTPEQAVEIILLERRKEMPCRGVRWSDIRRLNLEKPNIKLKRILNTEQFELQPNSLLYALPIPPDAALMGNYKQNERE